MSEVARAQTAESAQPDVFERIETLDQLIQCNWDLLEEAVRKSLDGRVYDEANERARQGWHTQANKHIDQLRKLMDTRETMDQSIRYETLREELDLDG